VIGDDGAPIVIAGVRLRALVVRLALAAGRPVAVDGLVGTVWGDDPPGDAANALQTLVSRARRALGSAHSIEQSAAGYRLAVTAEEVDACRFEQLAAVGRCAEAIALWRGPALVDLGEDALPDALRLHELRLDATLHVLESDIAAGDAASRVAELEALVAEHPLHERLAGLHMRALAAGGRQADALNAYGALRARLAEELGVDPGSELQATHLEILRGETPTRSAQPRSNLRAQLTSFVGREDEVTRLAKLLDQHRLVTLVGPGGAGKTRLANEAATLFAPDVRDGVWLVELAPVTDPADIAQVVLGSLGLRDTQILERRREQLARDPQERLVDVLADKHAVLVLDNCEHLIEATAELAATLLERCADLRIVTTSREPLGITGEALLAVPPLGQPEAGTPAEVALAFPAVRLFADRAGAVSPGFDVDATTVDSVIEIVRRLDGLPLAIELAAARLRTMPLPEIATRLVDRFRLLTGGSRTALPRHRTLRAVVEWSWDLLAPIERLLVERLAVYPAGVTTASAAAVCSDGAIETDDLPDLLGSLIDKSLLQPVGDGTRMRMLETIREYGIERLGEDGQLAEVRRWHTDYFTDLLTRAEPYLISAEQLPWFGLLTSERDNIVAALRFRCDDGDADGALDIAVRLAGFAMLLGNDAEINGWMGEALAVDGATDQELVTLARSMRAITGMMFGEDDQPGPDLVALAHGLGEIDVRRRPMTGLLRAAAAFMSGERELSLQYTDEGIAVGDPWLRAALLMLRASLAENEGDIDTMRTVLPQAVAQFRTLGERWGLGGSLRSQAWLLTCDGDLDAAQAAYDEALALMTELGSREDEAFLLVRQGEIAIRRGDVPAARAYLDRAQRSAELTGWALESAFASAMLAQLERHAGRPDVARSLQRSAAERMRTVPAGHPAFGHGHALVHALSAQLALADGQEQDALELATLAYTAAIGTKDMPVVANVGLAVVGVTALRDPQVAAVMLGACARVRGTEDRTDPEVRVLAGQLEAALGGDCFETAYGAGLALSREDALARLRPLA
jgi:predicted ATPase